MKKNIYALLAVMVFSAISDSANAILIKGSPSCGTWVKNRQEKRAGANESWLLGYLSGLAIGLDKDFLQGTDTDSLMLWLDNYCRDNPLKGTHDAAHELAKELMRNKGM